MRSKLAAALRSFQTTDTQTRRIATLAAVAVLAAVSTSAGQPATDPSPPPAATADKPAVPRDGRQNELDAAFAKMLSGATLEGSFTNTAAGRDPTKLSREKYTLGEVRKLAGNIWLIPSRIQYGDHDVTLPVTVPVQWAGDTPVIVVDNVGLPGFGTVSARVMFFADHYAGYWKHGRSGGHLFGVIHREDQAAAAESTPDAEPASSAGDAPADEQRDK